MTDLIAHGVLTRVFTHGTGGAVLYLHGWGTSHASMLSLSEKVGGHAVLYDFPGFGASDVPPNAWHVSDYAAHLAALLKKLDVTPQVVVAHSFGGRVLLKALHEAGLTPERVVFIGCAGLKRRGMHDAVLGFFSGAAHALSRVPVLSQVVGLARGWVRARYGSQDYARSGELAETFKLVVSENLQSCAEKVRLPTLLIWGSDDSSTPLAEAEAFRRAIPNSELVVLQGAGHFVHEEKTEEVAKLVRDFIA